MTETVFMASKYIFITGGVMSSLGKGIAASSIGTLLQARGFSIKMKKLDPYINVDPGTMSPFKHGEVFVMGDGCEADLDFGHYERFTDISCTKNDSLTTGKVYLNVLEKERNGDYLGSDIQVIPHITNEIKDFIQNNNDEADFVICEIGGTVGDIEGLPYIETLRQMKLELGMARVACIHLTYLPFIKTSRELKTKPTQHSVKQIQSMGVQPDILLCRSEMPIDLEIRSKLSMFCNIKLENVVEALDVDNIYTIPVKYSNAGLDSQICEYFGILSEESENIAKKNIATKWESLEKSIYSPQNMAKIAIVGKYTKLKDAYISLSQAIIHAGFANDAMVDVDWIDAEDDWTDINKRLQKAGGIIIPGGFGDRGLENKINAIRFARENNTPFLGICLGMQLAVIEACRNIAKINANSREFSDSAEFVVDFMDTWTLNGKTQTRNIDGAKGGTMRLGNYVCKIVDKTLAMSLFKKETIVERHRHRYEVNIEKYAEVFREAGIIFSGMSVDGRLPEILERIDHPFFIATQSHPEFLSRPFAPHPLFEGLVRKALT